MAKYYVFTVNSLDMSTSFVEDTYKDAIKCLNDIFEETPVVSYPLKGYILSEDMEVLMDRHDTGKFKDGMD